MIINLLGKGDGWDRLPDNPEGLVWGVNDAFLRTKCDATFHMHDLEAFYKDEQTHSSMKLTILNANEQPEMDFWTLKPYKEISHAKIYPLEDIINRFKTNYFTSGPSYMIAYALYTGAKEIRLYGLNMTIKEEYIEQKPCIEFWVGMAMGMGVKVVLQHDVTSILKSKDGLLYGYLTKQWRVKE